MESAEILVQEMFAFADETRNVLALLRSGRVEEATKLLDTSLTRFSNTCSHNSTVDALATLMQGFQPPAVQTTGFPAMHNPR